MRRLIHSLGQELCGWLERGRWNALSAGDAIEPQKASQPRQQNAKPHWIPISPGGESDYGISGLPVLN